MEEQKNKYINVIILFSLIILLSCKGVSQSNYRIPDKVNLKVNDINYELNDNKKIINLIKDINKGKLLKDNDVVPYIFDVFFVYEDTIINLKSDGVYYIDNDSKIYPKNDLVKKYWELDDKDLLSKRPLEKLR